MSLKKDKNYIARRECQIRDYEGEPEGESGKRR